MTTQKRPSHPSKTAQPTTHINGGLFDTGTIGEAGFFPVDINTPDVFKVLSASTLFTKPDDDTICISLDGTGLEHFAGDGVPLVEENVVSLEENNVNVPLVSGVVGDVVSAGKDSNTSGMEAGFLEGFCDLSSYLNEGGTESLPDMMEISCLNGGIEELERLLRKRTATEAFVEPCSPYTPAEADNTNVTEEFVVNTDHDAYTCNAKQSRLASTTSRLSSTSSELDSSFTSEPSTSKDSQKYHERRRKNNIASRRSRQTRKQKFACMEGKAEELEAMNARLEQQAVELESLTKLMKQILVEKLSKKA